MPGETGSSIEGGDQGNGAISQQGENDQYAHARSQPVNIVCPTCGQIPSQGLRHYSGLSTSGYSNNVFGDIQNQIVYCCSHCASSSEHDTRGSERHPETSSRTAPSPSSTNGISRTHTRETLPSISERIAEPVSQGTNVVASNGREIAAVTGNSGGPGSAAESTTLSLIGLKTIKEPTTKPDDWGNVYSADAEFARLDIQDAHISEEKLRSNHQYPFVPLARQWKSCTVSIEAHQETGFRRLKIEEGDACEVWIPDSRVQVISDHTTLRLRFSNCNKLQPPGYYLTQNGTPMSVTTYHPEKPNVIFEVGFRERSVADAFCNHILRTQATDENSEDVFIQQSPRTTIMHRLRRMASERQTPCILIWKQVKTTGTNTIADLHDIVALSTKFDLDIMLIDQGMDIAIGHVDRLTYYPAFDQPDLPQNVKRTLDGAPATSRMEGGHLLTSSLCLNTTPTEAKRVINHILSKASSWKLKAMFPQLDVKTSSSKKLKLGSNSYTAQLTVWSEPDKHMIRISIRTSDTSDPDQKPEKKEVEWFSVALLEGEGRPTAELKQNVLTIKKIDCENGNCLSTSDLRPMDADSETDTVNNCNSSNSIDLELKFSGIEQVQQFREVVTDQFLRVTDN